MFGNRKKSEISQARSLSGPTSWLTQPQPVSVPGSCPVPRAGAALVPPAAMEMGLGARPCLAAPGSHISWQIIINDRMVEVGKDLWTTLTRNKLLFVYKQTVINFSLCSLPLVLSPDTTEKSLVPPSLQLPFRYLYIFI